MKQTKGGEMSRFWNNFLVFGVLVIWTVVVGYAMYFRFADVWQVMSTDDWRVFKLAILVWVIGGAVFFVFCKAIFPKSSNIR